MRERRFDKDESGVTVIEFGLLALPFFAVIGAILETGVVLLASQVMDSAVDDASRIIRTGIAQQSGFGYTEFRDEVCGRTFGLFQCNQFRIRVRVINSFSDAETKFPLDEDGNWIIGNRFEPGARNKVVLVEAYYKWPTLLNIMSFKLGHLSNDRSMLMSASRVFMNEPF